VIGSLHRRERVTARHEHPGRIESLTDGVFAVAMILLVLGLAVTGREEPPLEMPATT
jgi:uncharacterized membrane protein